jgi:hypothetical protein
VALGSLPYDKSAFPDPEEELRKQRARLRAKALRPVGPSGFATYPVRDIRTEAGGPDAGDHCAAAAVVACLEVLAGVRTAEGSIAQLYHRVREHDGLTGSGASLTVTLRLVAEEGVRLHRGGRACIKGYDALRNADQALGALSMGGAVCVQVGLHPEHLALRDARWPMPRPGAIAEMGHVLVGFAIDWQHLYALNCWGAQWGDQGKALVPLEYPYLFAGAYAVW